MNIEQDPDMKSGPENAPLPTYIKDFPLVVEIYNTNGVLIRKEAINYGNVDQRKWLGRLSFWAWGLGYSVETYKNEE